MSIASMETPFPPDSAAMLGGAGPSSIVSAASLGTAFDHRQVAHRVNFDANGRLVSGVLVFVELPSQVSSKHYKENPAALDLSYF